MMKSIPSFLVFFVVASFVFYMPHHAADGKRILLVSMQQRSHVNEMVSLGEQLLANGHEVFIILFEGYADERSIKNKGIQPLIYKGESDKAIANDFREIEGKLIKWVFDGTLMEKMPTLMSVVHDNFKLMHEDEGLWRDLKAMHFDFAMVDGFYFVQNSFLVPYRLGIPYGFMFSAGVGWWLRTPNFPSFVLNPLPLTKGYTRPMTFADRLQNLLYFALVSFNELDSNTELLEKYAPDITSWSQLSLNSSIFFVTRDHILDDPYPTMSHTVFLPGPTPKPAKPLPEDLNNFITQSKQGSILISFGSSIDQMPLEILLKFVDAFHKLPQYNFVWRIDTSALKGNELPSNVMALSWLPQNDILGHPNVALFITHCGNNGMYESVYHAVPMIGFPLCTDQPYNSERLVNKDIGIKMDIFDFTAEDLARNIRHVINDPRFHRNVRKLSGIYKDRPLTAREEMVYWIEHVMKFGGQHLRSPALDMPLYQFLCLDLLAFISALVMLMLGMVFCIGRCIFMRVFAGPVKEKLQ